mmetsp:Transcript_18426/g.37961  ORF Transcript_18426/g.37961 Transcript_18426/m.37961 type:complete len:132 (+) Transcript_18426:1009-1404(+)
MWHGDVKDVGRHPRVRSTAQRNTKASGRRRTNTSCRLQCSFGGHIDEVGEALTLIRWQQHLESFTMKTRSVHQQVLQALAWAVNRHIAVQQNVSITDPAKDMLETGNKSFGICNVQQRVYAGTDEKLQSCR